MTDPTKLEPRNGDFVAYVEALQEESLEALRRANQAAIANPLQVPDASEGGADLGRIAAEMQRRARAERGDETAHDAAQADMLRRTKESVAERRGAPLGFIGSACIMIGFFMTFAAMAEGREDLAGPFIFLMIVGALIGRIAKARR